MSINWTALVGTLTSTAVLAGALAYILKALLGHILSKDIESTKSRLALEVEEVKNRLDTESKIHLTEVSNRLTSASQQRLAELTDDLKKRSDAELEKIRADFQAELEQKKAALAEKTAEQTRIREEVFRWANPILGAVTDLSHRLDNILNDHGYYALSKESESKIPPNWAMSHDYFLRSTLYLFAQYFCWIRLFEQHLSFELFKSQHDKDEFLSRINKVGQTLSVFPLVISGSPQGRDVQLFKLQQRAIGEAMVVSEDHAQTCMGFHVFLKSFEQFAEEPLKPLTALLANLRPGEYRWQRLMAAHTALQELEVHCKKILDVKS